jgi:hypothetical protein
MFRHVFRVGAVLAIVLTGMNVDAAETGTKTMPDSSVNPPNQSMHHYRSYRHSYRHQARRRRECALPSSRCDNRYRVQN